ncbi:MAG: CotH kinase family protein, partial [Bacteroidetes bacterium]|nr:CotH kinase family protein [Bacteroidota bacterium]
MSINAQVSFNGTGGTISDNQNWISFPCTVSGLNPSNINTTYGFEKLTLTISHNNVSDLEAHLIAPDGTDVPIFTYVGGTGNNFTNTGFKNTYTNPIANGTAPFSGSYKPEGDLGLFNNGQNGNGTWYLRIRDNSNGYTGSLVTWSIRFGSGPAIPYTVVPFSTNLPIVILSTGGADIPDEPKIPANLLIIDNASGQNTVTDTAYAYNGTIGIEQRGSSSGSADKKSYGFETWDANYNEIDTGLLGMPAQSDWILSASHFDKTLMRNVLTYKLFNDMSHYASRTQYCELYLNGVYKGVYILMEKIKRDPNRVDIAKLKTTDVNGDDVSGGYIVKVDKFTGSGGAGFSSNYPPVNPSGDGIYFQYEYPSADSIVPQQQAYIQGYIDSFEAALFGGNYQDPNNGFRRYAGERTFMDFMFINEISKNVDGYRLSTYFYKDKYSNGGKLKAGPAWDFDISYMNANYCQAEIDTGWGYNVSYVCPGAAVPAYWERMMSDSLFRMRVRCRWASFRQGILNTDTLLAY